MDRERAKKLLPVIQAYAEGKKIQFLSRQQQLDGEWIEVWYDFAEGEEPRFFDKTEYRIKPRDIEEKLVYALGFKVPDTDTEDGYIYWSVADHDFSVNIECCLDFYSIDSVMNYYRQNRSELFEDYDTAEAIECRFKPRVVAKAII